MQSLVTFDGFDELGMPEQLSSKAELFSVWLFGVFFGPAELITRLMFGCFIQTAKHVSIIHLIFHALRMILLFLQREPL